MSPGARVGGALLTRYPGFAVGTIALAVALAAYPHGDFPLNDDWAYAHSVQWLLGEHRIRLSDWVAMNLLPQTLAGALVTKLSGFSFSALRHLTQVVSAIVAILALRWFVAAGLARRDALFASVTLVATPCWSPLANSFMTDLYGMAFALPAATLLYRALEGRRGWLLAAGAALAAAGTLQRQVVLVVPAAFLVAWVAANCRRGPRTLAIGLVPLVVALAAEWLYATYLAHGPGVPEAQTFAHGRALHALGKLMRNEDGTYRAWVASNFATIALYLGLFSAPFAWWLGLPRRGGARVAVVALAVIVLAAMALASFWPPWRHDQVLDAAGIGPFVLYDAQPRGIFPLDRSAGPLWYLAGASAAFGLAMLAYAASVTARHVTSRAAEDGGTRWFVCALIGAYLAPFVVTDYFDRYLLFVLPFVFALLASCGEFRPTSALRTVGVVTLAATLALSVMATHDYFAWNRARWAAIRLAETEGATPATLDGGFEYNAYYRYETRPRASAPGKSWWWVADDRFIVTFGMVDGYTQKAEFPVARWLPRTPSAVRLLERAAR